MRPRRLALLFTLALVLSAPPARAQSPTPSPTPAPTSENESENAQDAIEERGGSVPAIFGYMIKESLQEKSGAGTALVLRGCGPVLLVDLLLVGVLVARKAWKR